MPKPESIENRWDILYRDYPEVYEAFSSTPYQPPLMEQFTQVVNLRGKVVADVGAGTGGSTLPIAEQARHVIGIELETAMLRVAREKVAGVLADRISYVSGDALALPLADCSVDMVTAITLALWPFGQYRDFIREGLRVARESVVYVGITPGWYGGDLYEVIDDPDKADDEVDRIFREEYHFAYQDVDSYQDYGTIDHIVSTYGFIFGKKAIEHLRRENKTTIHWKFRVYWNDPSITP